MILQKLMEGKNLRSVIFFGSGRTVKTRLKKSINLSIPELCNTQNNTLPWHEQKLLHLPRITRRVHNLAFRRGVIRQEQMPGHKKGRCDVQEIK